MVWWRNRLYCSKSCDR